MGKTQNSSVLTAEDLEIGAVYCNICRAEVMSEGIDYDDMLQRHADKLHPTAVLKPSSAPEPKAQTSEKAAKPAKPKAPKAPKAAKPVAADPIADALDRIGRSLGSTDEEIFSKTLQQATQEVALYKQLLERKAEVDVEIQKVQKLESLPEGYRPVEIIEKRKAKIQKALAEIDALEDLEPMKRAASAHLAIDRQEKAQAAADKADRFNSDAREKASTGLTEWVAEETARFTSMMVGDIWLPTSSKKIVGGRLCFVHDSYWRLMSVASTEGIAMPLRSWQNLSKYVDDVFESQMARYSFTETRHESVKISVMGADGKVSKHSEDFSQSLPWDEMKASFVKALKNVHNKFFGLRCKANERDAKFEDILVKLGYWGSGKETLDWSLVQYEGKNKKAYDTAMGDAAHRAGLI